MKHYNISAAVILVEDRFFVVQRGESKFDYISKKFEFPGGKIEEGESEEEALAREIKEELNLNIENLNKFIIVNHKYPDFEITMNVFHCNCTNFQDLILREHLSYKLLSTNELIFLDWAEADIPIVNKLIALNGK